MSAHPEGAEQVRVAPEAPRRLARPTPIRFAGSRDPIHGVVAPADVRAGDPIVARVRLAGRGREVPAQVWRISPLGVELVRGDALAKVAVGDTLDVSLQVGTSLSTFRSLAVLATRQERGRELVAVRWDADDVDASPGEKREWSRWECGADYLPTGFLPNPVRYSDFLHFRISDISRTGMRLVTSLRNKFLIPGVSFVATCTFPTVGDARIAFHVVHTSVVEQGDKRYLALGVTYELEDEKTAERIGQYLLQFGPSASLRDLSDGGFRVRSSARAFEFGWVRSEREYREVLAVRRLAYVRAKKVREDVKDVDMADDFDGRSRILFAKYRGQIVASVRVMFPQSSTDPLKHDEYLTLPATMPARDELVEASKACTHPDFRGSDLFYVLLKQAALTTIQAGRRFIFLSSTDSLLPIYQRLGFRKINAGYVHPSMKLAHHLLLGDVAQIVSGKSMNPIWWNLMGGHELWSFARLCGVVPATLSFRARVAYGRLFKPIAALVMLWLRSRRGAGARP